MADRPLTMAEFLQAVDRFGTDVYYALTREGFHPNVIYAKAEKAARKGYTEYGIAPDKPWLTDKGRVFLHQPIARITPEGLH